MNRNIVNEGFQPFNMTDFMFVVDGLKESVAGLIKAHQIETNKTPIWIVKPIFVASGVNVELSNTAILITTGGSNEVFDGAGEIYTVAQGTIVSSTNLSLVYSQYSVVPDFTQPSEGIKTYLDSTSKQTREIRVAKFVKNTDLTGSEEWVYQIDSLITALPKKLYENGVGKDNTYLDYSYENLKAKFGVTVDRFYHQLKTRVSQTDADSNVHIFADYCEDAINVRVNPDGSSTYRTYKFNDTVINSEADYLWGSNAGQTTLLPFSKASLKVGKATLADSATTATTAINATYATSAGSTPYANNAITADTADTATVANSLSILKKDKVTSSFGTGASKYFLITHNNGSSNYVFNAIVEESVASSNIYTTFLRNRLANTIEVWVRGTDGLDFIDDALVIHWILIGNN